jgi:hypothetical protein
MAFTMEATQEGPPVDPMDPAWSEFAPVGITQLTCASFPLEMSVRTCVSGITTLLVQSEPVHAVALGGGTLGPHMC